MTVDSTIAIFARHTSHPGAGANLQAGRLWRCPLLPRGVKGDEIMWGYRDFAGRIVATNPNDMTGNTGWEEVSEDTVPEVVEEPATVPEPTLEERQDQVEAALIELAAIVTGGM